MKTSSVDSNQKNVINAHGPHYFCILLYSKCQEFMFTSNVRSWGQRLIIQVLWLVNPNGRKLRASHIYPLCWKILILI